MKGKRLVRVSFVDFCCNFAAAGLRFYAKGRLSSAKTRSDAAAAKWASGTAQERISNRRV